MAGRSVSDEDAPVPADDDPEEDVEQPVLAPTPGRLRLSLALAAVVVLADQLTKHWALSALADGEIIDLVGSLRFRLLFNTGSAFSFGAGNGGLIGLLAIVIVVVVLRTTRSLPGRLGTTSVGLVVGGAVGNLIDRALRRGDAGFLGGAVVDFVDLQWWPVFNVADAAIVVGAVLLVVASFVADRRVAAAERAAGSR